MMIFYFKLFISKYIIMNSDKKNILDDFLKSEKNDLLSKSQEQKIVLGTKEGLIERIDKKYVTNDGRQLLREQY